jgi:hypothetical protein
VLSTQCFSIASRASASACEMSIATDCDRMQSCPLLDYATQRREAEYRDVKYAEVGAFKR